MKHRMLKLFITISFLAVIHVSAQELQKIPGTKIWITPPQGFIKATNFSGFQQNESGSSIMVSMLPTSAKEMGERFKSKEALLSNGMSLIEYQDVTVNLNEAVLIKVKLVAFGQTYFKIILIIGSDKEAYLINGIYPEMMSELEPLIMKSLMSVEFNQEDEIDLSEGLKFNIDHQSSGFQLSKNISGMAMYSRDGDIPSNSEDQAVLMVATSFSEVNILDQKSFALNRLKTLPGGDAYKVESISDIVIDKLSGKIIKAFKFEEEKKNEMIYQIILFSNETYYVMIGICKNDFELNLKDFEKVFGTFKRNA